MVTLERPGTEDFVWKGTPLSMELNLWNVKEYEGKVLLRFDGEKVEFSAGLSKVEIKSPERYVLGYPEFYYGYKPWEKHSARGTKLPIALKDLRVFDVCLKFEVNHEKGLPLNFAMETWLTRGRYQAEASLGDVEVMVWLYHHELKPGGRKVGEYVVPMELNGEEGGETWELWHAEWGWDYLAFCIKEPIPSGRVKLNVLDFLEIVQDYLKSSSRVRDVGELFFTVWEIGTEFGSPETKRAHFEWSVRDLSLEVIGA